jgi:hypothetical protein
MLLTTLTARATVLALSGFSSPVTAALPTAWAATRTRFMDRPSPGCYSAPASAAVCRVSSGAGWNNANMTRDVETTL